MRQWSLKRQRRNRQAEPIRQALREELKQCELCRQRRHLQLHELAQGSGKRVAALDQRGLIIGLCASCHRRLHSLGCAGKVLGLAVLWLRRKADYSLQLFWTVNGRRWPEQEEVLAAAQQIEEE